MSIIFKTMKIYIKQDRFGLIPENFTYPSCSIHGAMLCINIERTLYRCPSCHIGYDKLTGNEL